MSISGMLRLLYGLQVAHINYLKIEDSYYTNIYSGIIPAIFNLILSLCFALGLFEPELKPDLGTRTWT